MRTGLMVLVLGTLISGALAAQEPQPPVTSSNCTKWSLKGLRLGIKLTDFKEAHPNAKHGRNWFRPDDRGRDWYFWAESRMHGVYNYVLPETDEDDATVISIVALIDVTDTTSAHAIDALVERWGQPLARDVPVATVRYFTAFGVPKDQVDWKATTWQDADCDVLVTVLDQPRIAPLLNTQFTTLTVSIDSVTKLVSSAEARNEARRKKADESTRP